MLRLLWLVPALPLAGFAVLSLAGRRLSRRGVALVGTGSVGLSALVSLAVAASFLAAPPPGRAFSMRLWTWIDAGGLAPVAGLYLDALSLVMTVVVTFVGFLIHLYSAEFMENEEGYSRFFSWMNLFVGMMLILLLADNLIFLYVGWEGVGLCSYLLIGFWYRDPANGLAARKAFVVTRIGDTAMAIGLFLLWSRLGTLDIQELAGRAAAQWVPGSIAALAAALLLLGGAVGKSAQLPLQTWLPDAMAGPSPVSALIHAATMVTAGVYLIARTHFLYELAPAAQFTVAAVGAATLLLAGFSALVQRDIKRVLAYSTISQIGYMFLALGVGAWTAAIFHFMTHAFFKALLFLSAGAVIEALDHEHDIFRMGGLRRKLPLAFWTFLAGGASLAGLPLITAGFYSKEEILSGAFSFPAGGHWLYAAAWTGAILTGLYIFRLIFLVFFGEETRPVTRTAGPRMGIPLAVLAVLSLVAGFLDASWIAGSERFTFFLETALPATPSSDAAAGAGIRILSSAAPLLGIAAAWLFFLRRADIASLISESRAGSAVRRFLFSGWGFDFLYDRLLVRPFSFAARVNRNDVIDSLYDGAAAIVVALHGVARLTQTGRVRLYAAAIAAGAVIVVATALFR